MPQTPYGSRIELLKRIAPFVCTGVIATWISAVLPGRFDSETALVAFVCILLLSVLVIAAPWNRLPAWSHGLTPLLFLGVVALSRHASGGAMSGVGALVLLPIIWFAFYGSRRQMILGVAGVAAVFLLPVIVIGGDLYPPQEWVRGGVWTLVTGMVGFTMQRLMTMQRHQADELRARAVGLKASTDLLEGTLRASTEYAIVATDPEGVINVFNSGAERMVGYTADEMIGETPGVYHDLVDIQERAEEIGLDVTEFILGAAREGRADTRQMTYVHKDGHRIPVEVTVSAMRDGDGLVNGFIAISSDISERLRVETALRASEAALFAVSRVSKEIADSADARQSICDAAIEVCGADIAVLFEPEGANRLEMTASSGVDLPAITIRLDAELSGTGTAFVSGERLFAADSSSSGEVSARLNNALGARSVLFEPVHRDGQTVGVLTIAWRSTQPELSALVDHAARLLASDAGVAIQRSDLVTRLEGAALTDALTGLANRRAWDEELPKVLESGDPDRPAAIALLDLDHFKAYNDTHGHQAGDRLLVEASAAWRDQLREGDVLARYGGEEFALLLPATSVAAAHRVTERIRRAVPASITCSAGLAIVEPDESGDSAVARADAALYEAKARGRDTLLEYTETEAWSERSRASGGLKS